METCDALLRQLRSAPGKVPLGPWLFPRSPSWPGKEVTRTASDLCLVPYTEISSSLPLLLFPKAYHPFPHSKAHVFITKGRFGNQEKVYHNFSDNCPAKKRDGLRKRHPTSGFWFKTVALVHGTSSVPWGSLLKSVAAEEQPQLRIHGGEGDCSGRGHPVQQAQMLDSEHTGKTVDRSGKGTAFLYFNTMKKIDTKSKNLQVAPPTPVEGTNC